MKILVLCTGNSCRSQMAEGWLRHFGNRSIEVFSAGTHPEKINSMAIQVMLESGIDISTHTSNLIDEYLDYDIDIVLSVCANAERACPVFPKSVKRMHKEFDDPAKFSGSEEEVIGFYREVRGQIKDFTCKFIENLDD
ncbi:MAG TPA: arsenate reductase ArsC [Flavobacteriales bacterium]|nr:arsenate reductase ArsC [Flavobacteriales bacterium]HIN38742.1 arsenate reductase ArsC [Flavobacteriales bacterium]